MEHDFNPITVQVAINLSLLGVNLKSINLFINAGMSIKVLLKYKMSLQESNAAIIESKSNTRSGIR